MGLLSIWVWVLGMGMGFLSIWVSTLESLSMYLRIFEYLDLGVGFGYPTHTQTMRIYKKICFTYKAKLKI
jgi:hypothetical protein